MMKSHFAIWSAAIVLLLGSALILCSSGFLLLDEIRNYQYTKHLVDSIGDFFFIVLPLAFSLAGILTAFAIMKLREVGRKGVIFLSSVSVVGCALLVLTHPHSVFPGRGDSQYSILTIGGGFGYDLYVILLIVLIPLSIWWLILFTRPGVRSQFH